ncbi:MAG: carbohydrate kinase family protein [Anaerolineaceae bacterium]|nr:carbohydrate kinase family protein [Anaerolineaceae bacterium]
MGSKFAALVAGAITIDIFPNLDHLPQGQFETLFQPGHLIIAGEATFATGGPPSNVGLTLSRLGVPTTLAAKIGADRFGEILRSTLQSHTLNAPNGQHLLDGLVVDPAESTSYSLVINPPGVDRIFIHCPGANSTFRAANINYDLVAQAGIFHFGYPPIMRSMYANGGSELASVFQQAKAAGATTSLDTAFPDPSSEAGQADWPAIFQAVMPSVDIFLPSIEELLFMMRRSTYQRLLKSANGPLLDLVTPALLTDLSSQFLQMGVKMVVIKLGERGLYLRTAQQSVLAGLGNACPSDLSVWADRELWSPCFQVKVAGTTGSGDATIAGFLSALLRDLTPEQAVTAAAAVGACNVEAADALGGIRSWEETQARIAAGWPRRPLNLDPAIGWHANSASGIWHSH